MEKIKKEMLKVKIFNEIVEDIIEHNENTYEKLVKLEGYIKRITRKRELPNEEIIKITLEAMNLIIKEENKKEED